MDEYPDDIKLVDAYNRGEINAFNKVYNELFGMLRYTAYRLIPDNGTADLIVSDVFIRNWESKKTYENFTHLKNSLFRSIRNRATDIMRSESSYKSHLEKFNIDLTEQIENFEATQFEAESLALIYKAALHLPAQCKLVFDMLYLEDYTFAEVADLLGIAERTVRNQKAKAIITIKNKLKDRDLL